MCLFAPRPLADTAISIGQQMGAILFALFQNSSDDLVVYKNVNFAFTLASVFFGVVVFIMTTKITLTTEGAEVLKH